jgi:hypothetical protein
VENVDAVVKKMQPLFKALGFRKTTDRKGVEWPWKA